VLACGARRRHRPRAARQPPLTAQDKALAFIFFDISSCVGALFW
jgi:hypothetical protein